MEFCNCTKLATENHDLRERVEKLTSIRQQDERHPELLMLTVVSLSAFWGWPSEPTVDYLLRYNSDAVAAVDTAIRNRLFSLGHGGDFEAADAAGGGDDEDKN